jgi:twitching motility protein PilT
MVRAMVAGSLQAVISQVLLKRKGGGRAAAHEIMVGTSAVRNLIRENKIPQLYSMIQVGQRYGMQTMDDSIKRLVESGVVDPEEAASMNAKLSDDGQAPGAPKPAAAAPTEQFGTRAVETAPAAAPAPEQKKSRSIF